MEFFISPEQFKQLQPQLDSKPSITYMAINSSGEVGARWPGCQSLPLQGVRPPGCLLGWLPAFHVVSCQGSGVSCVVGGQLCLPLLP